MGNCEEIRKNEGRKEEGKGERKYKEKTKRVKGKERKIGKTNIIRGLSIFMKLSICFAVFPWIAGKAKNSRWHIQHGR